MWHLIDRTTLKPQRLIRHAPLLDVAAVNLAIIENLPSLLSNVPLIRPLTAPTLWLNSKVNRPSPSYIALLLIPILRRMARLVSLHKVTRRPSLLLATRPFSPPGRSQTTLPVLLNHVLSPLG